MLPAFSLGIVAPTGGEQMEMGVVLPIAAMRVKYRNGATAERLAPHLTVEIVQALCPAAHERAQHNRRVLIKGRAEHRGYRQDDVPIDHPLVEDLTHLAHPVVGV